MYPIQNDSYVTGEIIYVPHAKCLPYIIGEFTIFCAKMLYIWFSNLGRCLGQLGFGLVAWVGAQAIWLGRLGIDLS